MRCIVRGHRGETSNTSNGCDTGKEQSENYSRAKESKRNNGSVWPKLLLYITSIYLSCDETVERTVTVGQQRWRVARRCPVFASRNTRLTCDGLRWRAYKVPSAHIARQPGMTLSAQSRRHVGFANRNIVKRVRVFSCVSESPWSFERAFALFRPAAVANGASGNPCGFWGN